MVVKKNLPSEGLKPPLDGVEIRSLIQLNDEGLLIYLYCLAIAILASRYASATLVLKP